MEPSDVKPGHIISDPFNIGFIAPLSTYIEGKQWGSKTKFQIKNKNTFMNKS